MSSIEGEEM